MHAAFLKIKQTKVVMVVELFEGGMDEFTALSEPFVLLKGAIEDKVDASLGLHVMTELRSDPCDLVLKLV